MGQASAGDSTDSGLPPVCMLFGMSRTGLKDSRHKHAALHEAAQGALLTYNMESGTSLLTLVIHFVESVEFDLSNPTHFYKLFFGKAKLFNV